MITRDGRSRANFPWTSSRRSEVATGPCFKRGARPRASPMGRSLSSPIRLRRSVSLAISRSIAHTHTQRIRRSLFGSRVVVSPFRSISFFFSFPISSSRRRSFLEIVSLRERSTRRKYRSLSPPPPNNNGTGILDASSGKSADRFLCPSCSRRVDVNNFDGGKGGRRGSEDSEEERKARGGKIGRNWSWKRKEQGGRGREEEEGKEEEEEEEEWKDKSWRGLGP